jgi:hypothetical protein
MITTGDYANSQKGRFETSVVEKSQKTKPSSFSISVSWLVKPIAVVPEMNSDYGASIVVGIRQISLDL